MLIMFLFKIITIIGLIYALVCLMAYWLQETLLFHPEVLPMDLVFKFEHNFEELYLEVAEGVHLHALHFKLKAPKGLVFYVHGNAGSLQDWGSLSSLYASLGYDLLMFDYRGFGKSNGKITSQKQFFADVQAFYDYAKNLYDESTILVEGFSIGTASATKIAVDNNPRYLILKAPYYSLPHLIKTKHPYLPSSLLKYRFMTIDFLKQVKCPVTIFHGTIDELIPIANSERLAAEVPRVEYIPIVDCLHNDIPYQEIYKKKMQTLLI
ncbi:alpha/beta hydrolase [Aureispira anguillae]|uniref:Lysophospholipase n=1 Tax=Aureispira anguillae TaxID=2864201 RepID=A0A915YGA4_9BACT|nr:lysophospholipase [Aureispira anguillae]BDS12620.1 lysophospholipase [Aureispira anguillae]